MNFDARMRLLSIAENNQVIKQHVQLHKMPKFLAALEEELTRIDAAERCTEDEINRSIRKAMSKTLCEFSFPRAEIGKAIELCMAEFARKEIIVSKITGRSMSDSLEGSIERMKKQLPDILIPDFVKYMEKLEDHPEAAEKYEPDWQHRNVWYKSQKEHVMRWMLKQMTHGEEKKYHRDNLNISSRTSYNHWNNPGMALWLLAALGEDKEAVISAAEEAFHESNVRKRPGIVRKHFPFDRVLELLNRDSDGEEIIIRTANGLDRKAWRYR